jgi:hypothetical protein
MEPMKLSGDASDLHIDGYPDGVKVIRLDGQLARRAADLALHQDDLDFSLECLSALEGRELTFSVEPRALWHAAIVHFMKCFGSSRSRFSLQGEEIYRGKTLALEAFRYFRNIRNKHLVHDENSYHQANPGAIINGGGKTYKIEKIVVSQMAAMTLDPATFSNLKLLIEDALVWVRAQFDDVAKRLTDELEQTSHADLLTKEQLRWDAPRLEDIAKPRTR